MNPFAVVGALLGVAGGLEAVLRPAGQLSVTLLVALFATVPVAFARTNAGAVAAVLTPMAVLSVALHGVLTAGVAGAVVVWSVLGRRHLRRARRAAAARTAAAREVEDALLELTARGERARIARELHDVVAHHISMISVQAETARLTTPGMPADGARQLRAIGDTARTALTEMRRLLGVLRADAEQDGPARAPQPGLQQLLELLDEMRQSAGAGARLIVRGPVVALDPGVELTAYRLVQEALTNCRRHAPGAAVDVTLDYDQDAVRVAVRDNGPGPGRGASGHGLVGMRERVDMVGGTLRTGPAPGSGFLVEAVLPV
ncbi:sensor histidine kinase [Actinophytocola sediminis]